ncbi:MAG: hypothetical protein IPM39_26045 [Chloroflexi bacterium]|nr:hypothetical protein [Chloroflexota bacterium]
MVSPDGRPSHGLTFAGGSAAGRPERAAQKWLAAPARQRRGAAAGALEAAAGRLMADRQVRQWLEWPTDRYGGLPRGALIFGCRGQEWARRQLLLAALLAAHGRARRPASFAWAAWEELELERARRG